MSKTFRKASIPALFSMGALVVAGVVLASNTATFNLTINPGTLAVDIVDDTFTTVASPTVDFAAVNASVACGSTTGTLGTATQQIYVTNPDAADNGYTVTLGPTAGETATWSDGGTNTIDFNDESNAGCDNGQLVVSAGVISDGQSSSDLTTDITAQGGSFTSTVSSVTLVNAAATSADISEVVATGFGLTQTIPGSTPAASYSLPMTISIVASGL